MFQEWFCCRHQNCVQQYFRYCWLILWVRLPGTAFAFGCGLLRYTFLKFQFCFHLFQTCAFQFVCSSLKHPLLTSTRTLLTLLSESCVCLPLRSICWSKMDLSCRLLQLGGCTKMDITKPDITKAGGRPMADVRCGHREFQDEYSSNNLMV